ncbi:MAG: reactive intermediate/imine deaminase [Proteobacteria bacterium]|nr:reactive intermediate/imine deaminase [Pseudomonadota bacterium]
MEKKAISTDKAPQAIGPYSQGIQVGEFLFLSGQIPLDPSTGEMVREDIQGQTRRVMENLKAVLESQGLTMESVVKTTIFLTDMGNFAKVNEIYGGYFSENPPARSTVQVSSLPRGVAIEIEAIAVVTHSY